MTPVLIVFSTWGRRQRAVPRDDGAEEKMLNHRQFVQYLCAIHFDHAGIDFVPCFHLWVPDSLIEGQVGNNRDAYSRDVVQHGRMPPERGRFNLPIMTFS